MFTVTALEKKILATISTSQNLDERQLKELLTDEDSLSVERAIEGCIHKEFIRRDDDVKLFVTDLGLQQI